MLESIFNDTLGILTMIIYIVYLAAIVIVIRPLVQPFAYKSLLVLATISLVILLINRAAWTGAPEWTRFWHWFRSMTGEFNLQATFSAAQLLGVAITALVISAWGTKLQWWVRLYWILVAAVFAGMAADEYYMLHEGHNWVPVYAAIGMLLLAFSAVVFWYGLRRQMLVVFVLMFGGLGVMAAGGVVLEHEAASGCTNLPDWLDICHDLPFMEEALEIVGIGLVLAGVLTFAQKMSTAPRWPRSRLVIVGGTVAATLFLMSTFWVVPQLEARYLAQRIDARYLDGEIGLMSYRLPQRSFQPGDTVKVAFYWRAESWIPMTFHLSAQLLTFPDAAFVDEHRIMNLDPPAPAWIPGFVRKISASLTIPNDVDTPTSLVVSAPIWYEMQHAGSAEQTFVDIPVQADSIPVFGDYLPEVTRIAVLPSEPPPAPPIEANVQFASGIVLTGFDLPDEFSDTLDVAFWWEAEASPDHNMLQIFHLFEVDGDGVYILDRAPFESRFPTSDWVRGMRVRDTWSLDLPDDMPAGEFRVITGFHDEMALHREPIVEGGDLPVQDNLVELGIIRKID